MIWLYERKHVIWSGKATDSLELGLRCFQFFSWLLPWALARTASMLAWIKVEGDQSVSGADCAMAWVFVFVAPVPASRIHGG